MYNGAINVLKPPGMTSHDVVSYIRRIYSLKKVGHAGTLDPAAAGVLPVFIGSATRLIEYLSACDKSYRVELTFGYQTDTGDDTGLVINSTLFTMPSEAVINNTLYSFLGSSAQIPPMYSAVKVAGKKLYEYARRGVEIERQPREITISKINLLRINSDSLLFDVICSKGTYIRTLCADIGKKLSIPAVMSFLIRTRVGSFKLSDSYTLEEISNNKEQVLIPPDHTITHIPHLVLSPYQSSCFINGQRIAYDKNGNILYRIYNTNGDFLGIATTDEKTGYLNPLKVMPLNK